MFTATLVPAAQTANQDVFELLAGSATCIIIHEYELIQTTEVKDAEEEQILVTEKRGVGSVTSGSGGSTVTPQPVSDGDGSSGATVETNNTTKMAAGSGSIDTLRYRQWNVRMPLTVIFTPETRPVISPGNRWALEIAAPGDSVTLGGTIVFEVIGG
jgi:hypothetical protein